MSSSKSKWTDFLDKRVLVKQSTGDISAYLEYIVRGVSPSGTKIKLENRGGRTFWCDADEYTICEVLNEEKK